jgi:hypothetical protein
MWNWSVRRRGLRLTKGRRSIVETKLCMRIDELRFEKQTEGAALVGTPWWLVALMAWAWEVRGRSLVAEASVDPRSGGTA